MKMNEKSSLGLLYVSILRNNTTQTNVFHKRVIDFLHT